MDVSLPTTVAAGPSTREACPTPYEKPSFSPSLSGRNSTLPKPPPPSRIFSRDRGTLVARRNEAEARLRNRFLRFGSAVCKLVGSRGDGPSGEEDRAPVKSRHLEDGDGDGEPTKSALVTNSRFDDLRKRRSDLESLSSTPKEAKCLLNGAVNSTATAATAANDPASRDHQSPPAAPVVVIVAADAVGDSAAEDRRSRIESLKNRRRQLEARTNQLLRGEAAAKCEPSRHSAAPALSLATAGMTTSLLSATAAATTTLRDDRESGHPKRPRREATTTDRAESSPGPAESVAASPRVA